MRAILIDAYNAKIQEIDIDGSLESWYEQIKCSMVELAVYLPMKHSGVPDALMVDEEGALAPLVYSSPQFTFDGKLIYGNGLIVGCTLDGDNDDAQSKLEDIIQAVRFYNW